MNENVNPLENTIRRKANKVSSEFQEKRQRKGKNVLTSHFYQSISDHQARERERWHEWTNSEHGQPSYSLYSLFSLSHLHLFIFLTVLSFTLKGPAESKYARRPGLPRAALWMACHDISPFNMSAKSRYQYAESRYQSFCHSQNIFSN